MNLQAFQYGFFNQFEKRALRVLPPKAFWKRPISGTIGRLQAPLTAAVLGSSYPFRYGPTVEDVEGITSALGDIADIPGHELEVQLGSSRPLRNIKRTWTNPKTSLLTKLWGTVSWPFGEMYKALMRGDSYDPFSHSVALYQKDPAVIQHELGHAEDWAQREDPGLYAFKRAIPLYGYLKALEQEHLASTIAGKRAKEREITKEEMTRLNRVLGGGIGSYAGNIPLLSYYFPALPIAGALAGQAYGRFAEPFTPEDEE